MRFLLKIFAERDERGVGSNAVCHGVERDCEAVGIQAMYNRQIIYEQWKVGYADVLLI